MSSRASVFDKKQLFNFMMDRIQDVGKIYGLKEPQAFGRWFAGMYFSNPTDFRSTDGSGDGKVDLFFRASENDSVESHVLNTKFTRNYDSPAPVSFYDEITRFWQAFANKAARKDFLKTVREEQRPDYKRLWIGYDEGRTNLMFVTNHRKNERQFESVRSYGVQTFHLEDVIQFMADHIEDAMPRTPKMLLSGIAGVLSPDQQDTKVPTSIVFARLTDFIEYMRKDRFGLLFARNVRLSLGNTAVNKEIRQTFEDAPAEFAFSNNGITMICERHRHDPGARELSLENPRVVNGSQTLHSIRLADSPSGTARVMVRIIEVPPPSTEDLPSQIQRRKEIIHKISIRSNRQNPIKKWNLVANDDFQQELAREFRKKDLFYERRDKEWQYRKAELRSLGVQRGPNIRSLAQLIASFYFDKKLLGPANAKSAVGELFEEKPYDLIREASPEICYQVFLLADIVDRSFNGLAKSKQYIRNLRGHANLGLFSMVVRVLGAAGFKWGKSPTSELLESESQNTIRLVTKLIKLMILQIQRSYRIEAKKLVRQGRELTLNNFFKSQKYVGKLVKIPSPPGSLVIARRIVSERIRAKV
jgi:hypothetical protein